MYVKLVELPAIGQITTPQLFLVGIARNLTITTHGGQGRLVLTASSSNLSVLANSDIQINADMTRMQITTQAVGTTMVTIQGRDSRDTITTMQFIVNSTGS